MRLHVRACFVDNMASFGDISRMSAARYNYPSSLKEPNDEQFAETKPAGEEILCGTQLSPKRSFHGKNMTVHALPIIVDFRRLLSLTLDSNHAVDVVAGVSTLVVPHHGTMHVKIKQSHEGVDSMYIKH